MAASVIASDNFVLLTNGDRFISLPTRSEETTQVLTIPSETPDTSVTKDDAPKQTADSGPNRILATALSRDGHLLAVCDDRKFLHLYRRGVTGDGWLKVSSRCAARRCTAARFTLDSGQVLVADKSGDVYSFPVTSQTDDVTATAEGELKLGHLSMLLDMMLVEDDGLVVTCDRDEKVRVSSYPQGHDIQAFCLGHTAFVISLAYDSKQKVIMSGSGDCTVRLWTLDGKQLLCYNVLQDLPTQTSSNAEMEVTDDQVEANDKTGAKVSEPQQAVRQIVYCEPCKLMCVAMYRSSSVLVYRVTPSLMSGVGLTLTSSLTGTGHVISMCLHNCVLWLLRSDAGSLSLSGHRLDSKAAAFPQINTDDESPEANVIQKAMAEKEFLQVTEEPPDMFPRLRKSGLDGYVDEYKERKRLRIEGNNTHSRFGKKKKDQKTGDEINT